MNMLEKSSPGNLLGLTARWTAGVRAKESLRNDHLFNDRWAATLGGMEGEEWVEQQSDDGIYITVRTRFFDDFLQRVTSQHAIRQVVLMAAGLDTRAFRLNWPTQTQLFELDQPLVLRYKEQVLTAAQPTCERQIIEVDLTGPWMEALLQTNFNVHQPSIWLLEGFLHYLPNENVTRILDEITDLVVPESWIGFDSVNSTVLTSPWTRPLIESFASSGTPWISAMDDPETFLAIRNWNATVTLPGEEEANYGRWPYPVIPRSVPDMPRSWFVTAQKK